MKRFIPKLILVSLVACTQVQAQETTATVNGLVQDSKGAPLASASVIIKHEPTGFQTGTQTNSKGIFIMPNLKPGGPYTIIISSTGFRKDTIDNVNLTLGNNPAG